MVILIAEDDELILKTKPMNMYQKAITKVF